MAERYTTLYSLPGALFREGAPVMICAGAMLRDNVSGNYIAQLKYYNLGKRTLSGMTVALSLFDGAGRPIGEEQVRRFSLSAEPDTEFGQKKALLLPYRNARSFTARVSEVRFADGGVWQDEDGDWVAAAKRKTLEDAYGDDEIAAQFRIRYGSDCLYAPAPEDMFWYCTCGAINTDKTAPCRRCRRPLPSLMGVDVSALRRESSKRVQEEKYQEELEEAEPKPSHALWKTLGVIAALALALASVIFFMPRALNLLVPLPSFEPVETVEPTPSATPRPTPTPTPTPVPTLSPEELTQREYDSAMTLLDAGSYGKARAAFLALGDFSDSAEMAREAVYRKAVALYDFIEQYDEEGIVALLSSDGTGTTRFSLTPQKALSLGSPVIAALRQACGRDQVDIGMAEEAPEGLRPMGDCVKELFAYLDDYRDSAERLEKLDELTDYTRDFDMLCEAGDIYSAYNWLLAYTGDFPHKDIKLHMLEMYMPFCSDWQLFLGDPTLLPMTEDGHSYPCYSFNSRVLIKDDVATLRFMIREGESDFVVDIPAEAGTVDFVLPKGGVHYYVMINQVDHLAYLQLYEGSILGSCEYERVTE